MNESADSRTVEEPRRRKRTSVQIETGVTVRHGRRCSISDGGPCTCRPGYQGMAWSQRSGKVVRRSFPTLAKARAWRQETTVDLRRGAANAPTARLLREEAAEWLTDARHGIARNRSGEPYKPSALRAYEAALTNHVLPDLGHLRLSAVDRGRIQALVDRLVREGFAPSTVSNAVLPLRVIFRRALDRQLLSVNPTERLALPRDRRQRKAVPEPRKVEALLAALPPEHRPLWSAAVFGGLRRGELQALPWECVDLDSGVLVVERSWDRVAGPVAPKSRSGERSVPIPARLESELRRHLEAQGTPGRGLVFSTDGIRPFDPSNVLRSVRRTWAGAGLQPLGFHEARHTYASLMIAAGVNPKALSSYMGHSSILVTIDRYGHLFPGNERTAADQLDRYLDVQMDGSPEETS